jgi:hypothetical protein
MALYFFVALGISSAFSVFRFWEIIKSSTQGTQKKGEGNGEAFVSAPQKQS